MKTNGTTFLTDEWLEAAKAQQAAANNFPVPSGADENPAVLTPAAASLDHGSGGKDAAAGPLCECGEPLVMTKLGWVICAKSARIYEARYGEGPP